MKTKSLLNLALMGILSSGLGTAAFAEEDHKKGSCGGSNGCHGAKESSPADAKYSETHSCAGKNICKGMGGCGVSAEKLKKLSAAAGVEADKAGKAHKCAGLNECKGLGGCKVTPELAAKLKAKQAK